MKCREAEYWLYSLRPNASWPAEVATHLQGCSNCQHLQARLRQIDQQINQLTTTPGSPTGKQKLLALIEVTPQTFTSPTPAVEVAWPWARIAAYVSAAAALLIVGLLIGLGLGNPAPHEIVRTVEVIREKQVEIIREKMVPVESQAERQLFATLLRQNARLVQSAKLKDRLDTLLDMADDCRQHALKLIDVGPREALPFTIDLYTQLLREGVVLQVQQAPEAYRAALKETARARLRKMADSVSGNAKPLPNGLEDHRDALEMAALQSIEEVELPFDKTSLRRAVGSGPIAPAAALVQFAIAYSSETDPVAKADTCSQCVQRLTPFMMLYLGEESVPDRGNVGQQFGEMIQFGIYTPLTSANAKEPSQAVKDQADRAIQATFEAVTQIEKQFEVAPDDAKVAIKKMLDASQKGKGKGPAWLRDPFASPDKSTPKKGKPGAAGKTPKKASNDEPSRLDVFDRSMHAMSIPRWRAEYARRES